MKKESAYKELEGLKIFVVYNNGEIGEYRSAASAQEEINQNDGAASSVKKVIIGNELGMLTERCQQLKCFIAKRRQGDPAHVDAALDKIRNPELRMKVERARGGKL